MEEGLLRAQAVFCTLCDMLDGMQYPYDKDESKLAIALTSRGNDFPVKINIRIDPEMQCIILLSPIPVIVPENKRLDLAIAVTMINNTLVDGSFDYGFTDGVMSFRMTSSFIGSDIGAELLDYMITVACTTVDRFNDKLFLLSGNLISLQDFMNDFR